MIGAFSARLIRKSGASIESSSLACWSLMLAVPLCLATLPTMAQDGGSDVEGRVARLAEPIVPRGRSVGIAIGILDATGNAHTYGFGRVRKGEDRRPDPDTLFELGSITKCFTSILLAEMTLRNEVRLQEPAEMFLPREARVPRQSTGGPSRWKIWPPTRPACRACPKTLDARSDNVRITRRGKCSSS